MIFGPLLKRKITMRKTIFLSWLFGFCLIVSGSQPPYAAAQTAAGSSLESVVIAIPSPNANFLPLVIAEEKGFYRAGGISARIQAIPSTAAVAAATSGEVHYLFATTSVIGAAMRGLPLRVVGFVNVGSFFLFAAPGTRSIADLKGKTIAKTSVVGLQDHLLKAMLNANGLDAMRDVNYLFIGDESLGVMAVKSGQVQAAIAQLPTPLIAEKEGLRILGNSASFSRFPTAAIGTSLNRLKSRPHEVKAVIRGTLLGVKHIKDHLDDSAAILARWQKLSPDLARRTLELLAPSWVENGLLTEDEIRAVIEERKKPLNLTRDFSIAEVVDFQLLNEVQKELGLPR
jgi:ABC-type nitrate/sulfonate/bicarbonate transport system substrate-binding protein